MPLSDQRDSRLSLRNYLGTGRVGAMLHHEKEGRNGGGKQMPLAGFSLGRTDDPANIMYPFTVDLMMLANSESFWFALRSSAYQRLELQIYTNRQKKMGS